MKVEINNVKNFCDGIKVNGSLERTDDFNFGIELLVSNSGRENELSLKHGKSEITFTGGHGINDVSHLSYKMHLLLEQINEGVGGFVSKATKICKSMEDIQENE